MRHALADDFVEEEQGAFSSERRFLSGSHAAADGQHRAEEILGRLGQRRVVGAGDHQRVPVKDWTVVEKNDEIWLVKDHVSRDRALDDLVKDAFLRGDEVTLCLAYERYPPWASPA
jgi:hypothetical protein